MKYTVNETRESKIVIKKSIFISYIYPIKNTQEFDEILSEIKKEHKNSTHVCYAYALCDSFALHDDGEPPKTAGKPILDVIKGLGLENVACIVVRYYGGINLGIGGLIRAYSQGAKSVIDLCQMIEKHNTTKISIKCEYEDYPKISDILIKNEGIFLKSDFLSDIFVLAEIRDEKFDIVFDKIKSINYKVDIMKY